MQRRCNIWQHILEHLKHLVFLTPSSHKQLLRLLVDYNNMFPSGSSVTRQAVRFLSDHMTGSMSNSQLSRITFIGAKSYHVVILQHIS